VCLLGSGQFREVQDRVLTHHVAEPGVDVQEHPLARQGDQLVGRELPHLRLLEVGGDTLETLVLRTGLAGKHPIIVSSIASLTASVIVSIVVTIIVSIIVSMCAL